MKMNYWQRLQFIGNIKRTGKGGKVSLCENRVDDWSVKSHKLMWTQLVWWSGKTRIRLFEIWSTWWTFPSGPFTVSLHKISKCDVCHQHGYHICLHVNKWQLVLKFVRNGLRHYRSNQICLKKWQHVAKAGCTILNPSLGKKVDIGRVNLLQRSRKSNNSLQQESWCLSHSSIAVTSFTDTRWHRRLL